MDALLKADIIILLHTAFALSAALVGALQFVLKKGTSVHRYMGRFWVVFMGITALSSFLIHEIKMIGPFSLIHLLSVLMLYSLWEGMRYIQQGNVAKHKQTMIALYLYGIVLTGLLTLLPGRLMNSAVFGGG